MGDDGSTGGRPRKYSRSARGARLLMSLKTPGAFRLFFISSHRCLRLDTRRAGTSCLLEYQVERVFAWVILFLQQETYPSVSRCVMGMVRVPIRPESSNTFMEEARAIEHPMVVMWYAKRTEEILLTKLPINSHSMHGLMIREISFPCWEIRERVHFLR